MASESFEASCQRPDGARDAQAARQPEPRSSLLAPRSSPGAKPILAATWQARVLDTGAVQDELSRLWAELGEPTHNGMDQNDGLEAERSGSVLMRANTLNLLAVAHSTADAERIEHAITHLTDFYPSRAIVFLAHTTRGTAPVTGLDVRVALLEQPAVKNRPTIRFECITVEADAARVSHLASVAGPLLTAELPDVLWWPGDPLGGSAIFDDLVAITDRLIVDTASLTRPSTGLTSLTNLSRASQPAAKVSDFAWARLEPWRRLISQFFDMPTAQPCLSCLDEIVIVYAGRHPDGTSGLSAALLTAGWLATRLEWQPTETLERTRDGWRTRLRSQNDGHGRDILLNLRSTNDTSADRCLGRVTLVAHGPAPGTFTVERSAEPALMTTSETPTMPRVSRMVYTRPPDDPQLLGSELQEFGRDRVYEEALAFAAGLLPEGITA